jgi:hypothetical protein
MGSLKHTAEINFGRTSRETGVGIDGHAQIGLRHLGARPRCKKIIRTGISHVVAFRS